MTIYTFIDKNALNNKIRIAHDSKEKAQEFVNEYYPTFKLVEDEKTH